MCACKYIDKYAHLEETSLDRHIITHIKSYFGETSLHALSIGVNVKNHASILLFERRLDSPGRSSPQSASYAIELHAMPLEPTLAKMYRSHSSSAVSILLILKVASIAIL